MNCFELGFLSAAQECGMPSSEASRILKSAYFQSQTDKLFKRLPAPEDADAEETQDSPTDLESLKEMLQQELIARHISAAKHKIQI
jgi:hypothetical protein